jgi:hypothetical protein
MTRRQRRVVKDLILSIVIAVVLIGVIDLLIWFWKAL